MIHRIVITGAESTGKSTLAQALSSYYEEPCTHEFVRDYANTLDRTLRTEDLEPIARGQLATEDAPLQHAKRLVIHDTNLLSSIIYAKHYFNTELDWVNQGFKARRYSLYLLCTPDIPWSADPGQRESPRARADLQAIFKTQLESMKLPYVEISGSKDARLKQAVISINRLFER